jgi:hypothetical protein
VQEALNNAPEGDGNTHLSSPSHFYPIIQAFLPIPEKTQSNQIARSASVSFNGNPSIILALDPSVILDALSSVPDPPGLSRRWARWSGRNKR